MLNIVIPMAGRGSRFANAGYSAPKPLIEIAGKPMICWVIDNIRPSRPHRFIFLCLAEHLQNHPQIADTLRKAAPNCEIISVNEVTEGAACTVLLARKYIDSADPLMIANADQFVHLPIDSYLENIDRSHAQGGIMTFWADHPKWSYCQLHADGTVAKVVEKEVISNEATVGIYNFSHGTDFVRAADQMIRENLRVNNEFYVAPTYNPLIAQGARIVTAKTGEEYAGMFGLGTPTDLDFFKTTQDYLQFCRENQHPEPDDTALTLARTVLYRTFFETKNIAGVAALLHEAVCLIDNSVNLSGKDKVTAFVRGLFNKFSTLRFSPRNIHATGAFSLIEFELQLDSETLYGVDLIDWEGAQIRELRAYLSPRPSA